MPANSWAAVSAERLTVVTGSHQQPGAVQLCSWRAGDLIPWPRWTTVRLQARNETPLTGACGVGAGVISAPSWSDDVKISRRTAVAEQEQQVLRHWTVSKVVSRLYCRASCYKRWIRALGFRMVQTNWVVHQSNYFGEHRPLFPTHFVRLRASISDCGWYDGICDIARQFGNEIKIVGTNSTTIFDRRHFVVKTSYGSKHKITS
jgi:hypothetical protein